MLAKTLAFLLWAAGAAAAVYWGLHLTGTAPEPPPYAQPAPVATVASSDMDRVLGAAPVVPAPGTAAPAAASEQSRFHLLGVMAPGGAGRGGWATLAVDGKPARTIPVGGLVDGSSVLQKVSSRGVEIGPRDGVPLLTLRLSAPAVTAAPSTGRPTALPPPAPSEPATMPAPGGLPPSEAMRRSGPATR